MCIAGRSLERILRVAQATGYLKDFPPPIGFDEAMRLPRSEVLIIATGGQGEPRAALGRIASGTHELKLGEGDTVIFSSRIIPGNEIAIGRIMNQLSDLGVRDRHRAPGACPCLGPSRPARADRDVRLGPAARSSSRSMARRGTSPSMRASRSATACRTRVVQKNGDVIRLAPGEPKKIDEVRVGRLVLDGDVILPADGATVNERRRIGYGGLITVALPVGDDGKLAGKPLIRPFGVPVEEDRDDFIADATDAATRAYSPGGDEEQVREAVRLAVRRCATLWTGKKPLVEVMLLQVALTHGAHARSSRSISCSSPSAPSSCCRSA